MLSIQTNVNSMVAQENLRVNSNFQGQTITRLTSGYRINSSADDAAGLGVANKYRSDVTELMQGVRNANDGLSTLQIIDGGLNNISKMLDRLKTLATQSASGTFTGSRATLDAEYQSILGEVNRQAANVGLGSGDTQATANNRSIAVYIGGGSAASNSRVSVDLSASSNLVNASGLSLTGTSIAGNTVSVQLSATDYRSGSYLDQNSSQTYRFGTTNGQVSVTVQGDSDGLTGNDIVSQLNSGLAGTGLTVSMSASVGSLQISGSGSYAVAVDAKAGAGAQIQAAVTDANSINNSGKYRQVGGTVSAATGANQTLTFTPSGGSATVVTLDTTTETSVDAVFNKLRTGLSGTGIEVIRIGNEVKFESSSDFTLTRGADAGAGGLGGVAASANLNATDKSNTSDPTSDAISALSAISSAVSKLGLVQGKIGTGQNQLQYAIQLAQSQITSFSAAESRIRDADVAQEAANLTKGQVLQQASIAALAQANSAPQAVLSLLRG
jgi:flagellin